MSYWLIKSEEKTYSIDQMQSEQTCIWDGVRNYMARNFLRKMQVNDLCFFYHSNTKIPGIVGLVRVIESNIVDPTQFDENSPYYDPKDTANHPRWYTVRVEFIDKFPQMISLGDLKQQFDPDDLLLVRRGNRLSVMPIRVDIGDRILQLKISRSVS